MLQKVLKSTFLSTNLFKSMINFRINDGFLHSRSSLWLGRDRKTMRERVFMWVVDWTMETEYGAGS